MRLSRVAQGERTGWIRDSRALEVPVRVRTLSLAVLPERWRRWGLAVQVIAALLVQHLFYTSW